MIKKTIKYVDYNGIERTEDYYFHMSRSEIEIENARALHRTSEGAVRGGLKERIENAVTSGSGRKIMDVFEWLIKSSYGVKSEDGKHFVKSEENWEDFKNSPAFDVLFTELISEPNGAASDFVNGILGAVKTQTPQDFLPKSTN